MSMNKESKKLGRGLSSLLSPHNNRNDNLEDKTFKLINISSVEANPQQPRKNFAKEELEIEGVVLTMHDKRNSLSELVEKDVRGFFGDKVYKTIIPRNVRISEAPSHGKPVLIYDTTCVGSKAYIDLAKEVIFNQWYVYE